MSTGGSGTVTNVEHLRVARGTRSSRIFAVVALVVVAVAAFLPSWGEASTMKKMIELLVLLALASCRLGSRRLSASARTG
jgi:hypothetical protein